MQELFAGQILQGVKTLINQSEIPEYWNRITKNLSSFHCKNNVLNAEGNEVEHPIYTVIDNLLFRGLPTLISVSTEKIFEERLGITKETHSDIGAISFDFTTTTDQALEMLVLAEPRNISVNPEVAFQTWEEHGGSEYENHDPVQSRFVWLLRGCCLGCQQLCAV